MSMVEVLCGFYAIVNFSLDLLNIERERAEEKETCGEKRTRKSKASMGERGFQYPSYILYSFSKKKRAKFKVLLIIFV